LLLTILALCSIFAFEALGSDSVGSTDEVLGETVAGSIVLDVYLDSEGRALIVGYLETDRLDDLAFLGGSEYAHDEVTGELYAKSDGLTSAQGDGTWIEFEAGADWNEVHLAFYLPAHAGLLAVSCSEGLEYSVIEAEDSLKVEVLGYEVEGIEVVIDYDLAG